MAELFQNVPGLAGVLRMAGEGAKSYNEGIEKLATAQELKKKVEEFTETDAEKLTKEINKIKNFWAAEFGGTMVADLQKVVGLLGGGGGIDSAACGPRPARPSRYVRNFWRWRRLGARATAAIPGCSASSRAS